MLYVLLRVDISGFLACAAVGIFFENFFQNPVLFWERRSRRYSRFETRVYILMITPWTLFLSASGFLSKVSGKARSQDHFFRFSLLFSRFYDFLTDFSHNQPAQSNHFANNDVQTRNQFNLSWMQTRQQLSINFVSTQLLHEMVFQLKKLNWRAQRWNRCDQLCN